MDFESIHLTYTSLKNNLKRYPGDIKSIYECIGQIGYKHGILIRTQNLSDYNLFVDKYVVNPEPIVTDENRKFLLMLTHTNLNALCH